MVRTVTDKVDSVGRIGRTIHVIDIETYGISSEKYNDDIDSPSVTSESTYSFLLE